MKDSLLPTADNKPSSGLVGKVCNQHVMKLVALLALLSTAATAIGLYCFQSGRFVASPDLTQITSSYRVWNQHCCPAAPVHRQALHNVHLYAVQCEVSADA